MTRWARKGPKNGQNPLPGTDWSDLKNSKASNDDYEDRQKIKNLEMKYKEKSEQRRLKRIEFRQNQKLCYNCRETGHKMSECTKSKDNLTRPTGICFKCGSAEHTLSRCTVRLPDGKLPFAKCFVCNEIGHLSRDCPSNPHGLYPNGGCCNVCGSIKHLSRDCPERKKPKRNNEDSNSKITTLKILDNKSSVDEDSTFEKINDIIGVPKKKIKKIVTF